jgi:hypothetical protein
MWITFSVPTQVVHMCVSELLDRFAKHATLLWINDFNDSLQIFQGGELNNYFAARLTNLNRDSGV